MADANNKISVSTPFGPIAATGTAAIVGLLIVILLGFLYFELDKVGDEFENLHLKIDTRFKEMADVQAYNACVSRLTLWQAQRLRVEPINFQTMPGEFFYCLPRWLSDKKN